jgi:hypothetical protein
MRPQPRPLADQVEALDAEFRHRGADPARCLLGRSGVRGHCEDDDAPALGQQRMSARRRPFAVGDGDDRLARARLPIGQPPAFARPTSSRRFAAA